MLWLCPPDLAASECEAAGVELASDSFVRPVIRPKIFTLFAPLGLWALLCVHVCVSQTLRGAVNQFINKKAHLSYLIQPVLLELQNFFFLCINSYKPPVELAYNFLHHL